jgi:dihydropteroate synthase
MLLKCGSRTLDLTTPVVMGILNVTPDSFSDGGRWLNQEAAVAHALEMVAQGAAIVDVGGESTRPGAAEVSEEEELRRVVPVVEALAQRIQIPISVDTSRAAVAQAACAAGATMINDVRALTRPGMLQIAAASNAAICLMHMQGDPRDMQAAPSYARVVAEVVDHLRRRVNDCKNLGVESDRLVVDPGIGFGKRLEHNLALLRQLDRLRELSLPILVGVSRKSLIGALTGRGVGERLPGSIALATASVLAGASIIRAHDVGPTVDAVKIAAALRPTNE